MLILRLFRALAVALALLVLPVAAFAQDVTVSLSSDGGASGYAHLENRFSYPVKVVSVQVTFLEPDGSEVSFESAEPFDLNLQPGASTDIAVRFEDPANRRLEDAERVIAAVGVDIAYVTGPAQTALDSGDDARIRTALAELRRYIAPVSRAARLQASALARNEQLRRDYYDLERLDALVAGMEQRLCGNASQRIIDAGAGRIETYEIIGPELREAGLHVNCLTSEAKLQMAQTLIAGSRPQDALLFREVDDDGNLLPEWRPIILEASVAFATTAVELGASALNTLGPAITALTDAREIAPEDPRVVTLGETLIPRLAAWVTQATHPATEDMAGAMEAMALLHPTWSFLPAVADAGHAVATRIVDTGLELCRSGQHVAARNEFVRGERILEGIPAWDTNKEAINECRAEASLTEGREAAANPRDPRAPIRGMRFLEEARQRFDLPQATIDAYLNDMVDAWIAHADFQLGESKLDMARAALASAAEICPGGTNDNLRAAWLRYVDKLTQIRGAFMDAADLEDGQDAISRAEGLPEDQLSAARSGLTRAYYTLRVGIPVGCVVLALIAVAYVILQKQRTKRLASLSDLD